VDLLKILRSFEEFIFEVATWLYFYPVTLLRIVWRPGSMMAYAASEELEPEEARFDDSLSPPMLLLITLLLANALGWAAHVPRPPEASQLSHALFSSQQNLLLFRCLIFSLIPLVAALTLLRKQGVPVARASLRQPFYSQCYLAAPFALAASLGAIGLQRGGWYGQAGLAVLGICTAWLLTVQARWFRQHLGIGLPAAFGTAIWAFVRAIVYLLLIVVPVALI
jgi:hypothetical protein